MSGQSQAVASPEKTPPERETTEAPAEAPASNAEEQEKLRGSEGTEEGLAKYQESLGTWLGGELYGAIAPHLTLESLAGYADEGLEAALKEAVQLLGDVPGEVDEAAVKAFAETLSAHYGPLAGKWLEANGQGVTNAVAGWIDANPRLIVLIGLLAAGGAIAANLELPELKTKIGITDGLTAEIAAKVGRLRELALHEIKTQLAYESGPLVAAVEVEKDEDGDWSGQGEARLGDDERHLEADVTVTEDGLEVWGVRGLYTAEQAAVGGEVSGEQGERPTIEASLTREDGPTEQVDDVEYDFEQGLLTVSSERTFSEDGTRLSAGASASSDGSESASLSIREEVTDALTLEGGFQSTTEAEEGALTTTDRFSAGADWRQDPWRAGLDVEGGTDGQGQVSGSTSYGQDDDTFRAALEGEYGWGPEAAWKVGGEASYGQDDDNFRAALRGEYTGGAEPGWTVGGEAAWQDDRNRLQANYGFDSAEQAHQLNLLAQRNFRQDLALRGTLNGQRDPSGTQLDAGLHGAWFPNEHVGILGGGRYQLDPQGQSRWIPEVGAQIKGVPLMVGFDTTDRTFRVGLTLPF